CGGLRERRAPPVRRQVLLVGPGRAWGVRPGRRRTRVPVGRDVGPLARRRRGRALVLVLEPCQHAVRGGGAQRRRHARVRPGGARVLGMTAEWRGEVPTLDLLNRLVTEALPLGLRSGPAEPFFQRDIYFDSADWTLRRRGVSCRFRIRVDDRRILTLRTIGRWDGGVPLVLPQTFEADVPELEGAQALTGTSDPARRLRSLIDPALLLPRIQFETERRVPRTTARSFYGGRYGVV